MINKELQNKLRARYNPDGSDLRRMQIRMLDMLKQFDKFCKKYRITYWLTAGTLLGAVRHGGFIPWDDDLDLDVFREDYIKIINNRKDLENYGLILHDYKSDQEYIAPYVKLRDPHSEITEIHGYDKFYKYKGIWIDIFVRERTSYITSKTSHIMQYFAYKITLSDNNIQRRLLKSIIYQSLRNGIFPLLKLFDKLFYNKNKFRYSLGSGFYDYILKDDTLPTILISFEGENFPAPKNYTKILEDKYGNYNGLPSYDEIKIHYKNIIFQKAEE